MSAQHRLALVRGLQASGIVAESRSPVWWDIRVWEARGDRVANSAFR